MPIEKDYVIGKDCKAYRNTGTRAVPVWVELKRVQDVNVDGLTKNKASVPDRQAGWDLKGAGLKNAAISFSYLHKKGADADRDALIDSFLNDTDIEFAIMDGDISTPGNRGLRLYGQVFDMPFGQEMEEGQVYDIGIENTRVDDGGLALPLWHVVT